MNTLIWIIQGVLAVFFLIPGTMKLIIPKQKMIDMKKLKPGGAVLPVRMLGFVELLGAIGIIVPFLTGIFPILTPIAAVGFGLVMVGAFIEHYHKEEYKILPLLIFVFFLSLLVAWYRF
jgi:hypothetical protein